MLGASFLALVVFILAVGLMPHRASLASAKRTVHTRFADVHQISTVQLSDSLVDSRRKAPGLLDVRTENAFNVSYLPSAVRKVHPYNSEWGMLLPSALRSDQADVGDAAMARARPLRLATGAVLLFLLLWWETLAPFLPMFKNDARQRTRHGLRNIGLALLNSGMTALLFVGIWGTTANWAAHNGFGLLNWAGAPPLWHALAAVLALDFWTYWWHRMNHRLPFLWRFHRAHHSDAQMDVTTASRFHIGEILFSNCLRVPLILLLGIHLWEMVLYETALLAVIQFHHANIGLPQRVDQLLRCFLVTPAMHKVHHSRWQPETDSNYSSLLSIWDRVFRSFRLREDPSTIQFGLDEFAKPEDQTLSGILKTPLANDTLPPG